jgi:hypothetical protein
MHAPTSHRNCESVTGEFRRLISGEIVMGAQRVGKVTVCSELRRLGFASGRRAKLYGEEFEFVSDPEADDNGYCLKAVSHKSRHARHVRIPLSVVRTVERELLVAEKIEIARAA